MKRTLIHNATIVNEGQSVKGSVVIEDGRIAEVLTNWKPLSAPCDETIDATGCYLLPGIIDDHVHFRDPGLTHKADILTESRAAAAGGVTSIMDMPNTNPVTTTLDALNAKLDLLNEKCIVNHSCYFGATNDNYSEFGKLDKHRVCGIKLFMGSSTGNMLVDKMNSLLNIFNGTDMLIAAHCEDQETIKNNIAKYKEMFAGENDIPIGKHPYIRSSAACYASSELAVRLARIAGARLHILHVSTAKELQLFNDYSLSEKHITAEACVAHLLFTLSDYRTLGTRIKCNPAIKKQADRDALRAAVNSGHQQHHTDFRKNRDGVAGLHQVQQARSDDQAGNDFAHDLRGLAFAGDQRKELCAQNDDRQVTEHGIHEISSPYLLLDVSHPYSFSTLRRRLQEDKTCKICSLYARFAYTLPIADFFAKKCKIRLDI